MFLNPKKNILNKFKILKIKTIKNIEKKTWIFKLSQIWKFFLEVPLLELEYPNIQMNYSVNQSWKEHQNCIRLSAIRNLGLYFKFLYRNRPQHFFFWRQENISSILSYFENQWLRNNWTGVKCISYSFFVG